MYEINYLKKINPEVGDFVIDKEDNYYIIGLDFNENYILIGLSSLEARFVNEDGVEDLLFELEEDKGIREIIKNNRISIKID